MSKASQLATGTKVVVREETRSGRTRDAYPGTVCDVRTGVKCLGSVEYLVERDDGHQRWVPSHFVTEECNHG